MTYLLLLIAVTTMSVLYMLGFILRTLYACNLKHPIYSSHFIENRTLRWFSQQSAQLEPRNVSRQAIYSKTRAKTTHLPFKYSLYFLLLKQFFFSLRIFENSSIMSKYSLMSYKIFIRVVLNPRFPNPLKFCNFLILKSTPKLQDPFSTKSQGLV